MNILGINSFFDHPAVALIRDGKLVFAIEEERLTRLKQGKSFSPYQTYIPFASLYEALRDQGLEASDLDEIAFSYDKRQHLRYLLACLMQPLLWASFPQEAATYFMSRNIRKALGSDFGIKLAWKKLLPPQTLAKIPFTEHAHLLSHAASAFYCSGFEEALILVIDDRGENAATAIFIGRGNTINKVAEIPLPHSLGFFSAAITAHLGFEPFADEYKVMGMAAYGQDCFAEPMASLVTGANGKFKLNVNALKRLDPLFGPARSSDAPLEARYFDLATSAQRHLERTIVDLARFYLKKTRQTSLCLAGGTFQNILVNAKLASLSEDVKNIFIQPATHDAGTAIGAAALSWARQNPKAPQLNYESMFLGTTYDDRQIEACLRQAGVAYQRLEVADRASTLAALLADEKIVALFRGRMEFGPRALGNRSLLASPCSVRTREKLNELKVREQFRPLAPMVIEEAFADYFIGTPNRYMMMAVTTKDEVRAEMPAIVHADGTARAQVVRQKEDPFLHELLCAFQKRRGLPILINTSLNVRGKPIDESPYDALVSFYTSGIDYLAIGSFLVKHP